MNEERYPALYAPKDGYVFIVTYGRSGSTLTQKILNSIPDYCIRGENGNVLYHLARAANITREWDNYVWRRNDVEKAKPEQKDFLRDIIGTPSDPWYGAENVEYEEFSMKLFDDFVSQVIRPPETIRVAGFKEIRWHEDRNFFSQFLDTVKQFFPKTRFIFQTRSAESLSQSSWWREKSTREVQEMVSSADKMFLDYTEKNKNICFTVKYERLEEGAKYIKEFFDFLDEPMEFKSIRSILETKLTHMKTE